MGARAIDLSCDVGEGGPSDAELLALVSSASIACGAHAGDERTMRACLELARDRGVAAGAHPGLADRAGLGRVDRPIPAQEAFEAVLAQTRHLAGVAREVGLRLTHVKPHGALYNRAAREPELAWAVADAVRAAGPGLALYAPPASELARAGAALGLRVVREAFADRAYRADGSLVPRTQPGALLEDGARQIEQVLSILRDGAVSAAGGARVPLEADTVCVHGDGPHALRSARALRAALAAAGVTVRSWTEPAP
jgi:UPF0271 protein